MAPRPLPPAPARQTKARFASPAPCLTLRPPPLVLSSSSSSSSAAAVVSVAASTAAPPVLLASPRLLPSPPLPPSPLPPLLFTSMLTMATRVTDLTIPTSPRNPTSLTSPRSPTSPRNRPTEHVDLDSCGNSAYEILTSRSLCDGVSAPRLSTRAGLGSSAPSSLSLYLKTTHTYTHFQIFAAPFLNSPLFHSRSLNRTLY